MPATTHLGSHTAGHSSPSTQVTSSTPHPLFPIHPTRTPTPLNPHLQWGTYFLLVSIPCGSAIPTPHITPNNSCTSLTPPIPIHPTPPIPHFSETIFGKYPIYIY